MSWMQNHLLINVCYGFLFLSVVLLWQPRRGKLVFWGIASLLSILLGITSHQLDLLAIISITLFATANKLLQSFPKFPVVQIMAGLLVFILGSALDLHLMPGFHNLKVLNHVYISNDAVPYSLYINFDEAIVGIFILGFNHSLISNSKEWLYMIKQTVPKIIGLIFLIAGLAFILNVIHFDPKWPNSLYIWILINLLIVSVAEEAFYRGFIQRYLALLLSRFKIGNVLALFIASLIFGLAHYANGSTYVALAILTGIGYGWIYQRVKCIEASIFAHFSLNLTQFLLFTYPALAIAK